MHARSDSHFALGDLAPLPLDCGCVVIVEGKWWLILTLDIGVTPVAVATMNELEKLLYLTGISSEFLDYGGQRQSIPLETRLQALRQMGFDPDDAEQVSRAVYELDAAPWEHWLRHWYIVDEAAAVVDIHCHPERREERLSWELDTESGERLAGAFRPSDLAESGEYHLDGLRYSAHSLHLGPVAPGYHRLRLVTGTGEECAELIVCPGRCQDLSGAEDQRYWGVSCQLYTLRSDRNWGVGDFSDLQQLVALAAARGADLVGLNPLHAALGNGDDSGSPYSPSDRRYLNPLYIDPEQVPELAALRAAGVDPLTPEVVARCAALRESPLVDYESVYALKYPVLERLYQYFAEHHLEPDSSRGLEFRSFLTAGGEDLQAFCAYEVMHNQHAHDCRNTPLFFGYLQWLAAGQLAACQSRALSQGMRIGLMRDLAVGSVVSGCEVQQAPELYLQQVTIGAPPDPFADAGQDWGLPALNPMVLRRQRFRHFISLLRNNMASAGALRIDHAMALMRLWWCLPSPGPGQAGSGLYVYYPRDELLALLRLESRRNACLVVGEDLGVVPVEFRALMHQGHIYGNRLLYFDQHHDGRYRAPSEQQPDALLMVTNHDVATLADWWSGDDLRRRQQLGLLDGDEELTRQLDERRLQRQRLLEWLDAAALLPPERADGGVDGAFDMTLCRAIHRACARGASRLLLLQLEDLQLMREPVNIPGTYREYPNWRRKQQSATTDLFANPAVCELLDTVNEERKA